MWSGTFMTWDLTLTSSICTAKASLTLFRILHLPPSHWTLGRWPQYWWLHSTLDGGSWFAISPPIRITEWRQTILCMVGPTESALWNRWRSPSYVLLLIHMMSILNSALVSLVLSYSYPLSQWHTNPRKVLPPVAINKEPCCLLLFDPPGRTVIPSSAAIAVEFASFVAAVGT